MLAVKPSKGFDLQREALNTTDLVDRIRDGDRKAEIEFAEYFSRGLMLLLLKETRDPDIANDCCQQTLLITLRKMRAGKIVNSDRLLHFLRRTAKNVAITYFRKEKRYTRLEDGEVSLRAPTGRTAAWEIDYAVIESLLSESLDQLTIPRDKEILRRFYLYEEDKIDICKYLDVSSEHFDRVLHRAKKRLRAILDNQIGSRALLLGGLSE